MSGYWNFVLGIFVFASYFCTAQNSHEGVIYDPDEKEPIEFVAVYNGKDHTMSNADGRYAFTSSLDTLVFYRLGYQKVSKSFLGLTDTLYLEKAPYELDEVVVTNAKTLWQKVKDSITHNYLFAPFREKFFLRALLKNNDTLVRLQDIEGKLARKTLLYNQKMELTPKDFTFEFNNMRKTGVVRDEHKVYYRFPTLYGLFSSFIRLNATGNDFTLTEKPFEDVEKVRYEFVSNPNHPVVRIHGYYIINTLNNAIEEYHQISEPKNPPYSERKQVKFRTKRYELTVLFEKDPLKNKYYMKTAKRNTVVEISDKKNTFTEVYDSSFILTTSDSFITESVKKNVSAVRDIFKLKFPYNPAYWNVQNTLLLTDEMEAFIQNMGKDNTEFKVRSNIKD